VETAHLLTAILRKLAFLALIGFLVVVLAGPILAMLGVLVSFALIGLLVWMPIRTMLYGKPFEWSQVKAVSRKLGTPVWAGCHRITGGALGHGKPVLEKVQATGRFLGMIFREAACGALVGALLGMVLGPESSVPSQPALLGAGLGALLGTLVAVSFRAPTRETV
jgi:hypothetical protein